MSSSERQKTLRDTLLRSDEAQPELKVVHILVAYAYASDSDEANNNTDTNQATNMMWNDKWI